jgi:hypothetical protein
MKRKELIEKIEGLTDDAHYYRIVQSEKLNDFFTGADLKLLLPTTPVTAEELAREIAAVQAEWDFATWDEYTDYAKEHSIRGAQALLDRLEIRRKGK